MALYSGVKITAYLLFFSDGALGEGDAVELRRALPPNKFLEVPGGLNQPCRLYGSGSLCFKGLASRWKCRPGSASKYFSCTKDCFCEEGPNVPGWNHYLRRLDDDLENQEGLDALDDHEDEEQRRLIPPKMYQEIPGGIGQECRKPLWMWPLCHGNLVAKWYGRPGGNGAKDCFCERPSNKWGRRLDEDRRRALQPCGPSGLSCGLGKICVPAQLGSVTVEKCMDQNEFFPGQPKKCSDFAYGQCPAGFYKKWGWESTMKTCFCHKKPGASGRVPGSAGSAPGYGRRLDVLEELITPPKMDEPTIVEQE